MEGYPQIKELLNEKEFSVVVLHYLYGYSQIEVAKKMGITYIYVKKLIASAKEKLKVLY